ncbi:unnamed protein product [Phytophthora fragariaefolia]|uniref:Unnamed protein product n=1 Tax=Phytophthora fragariaefolia TaxID=1490495 RepID=A0A9W7CQE5_9STRA|nr:unnamed protein product [Phytophthora fragariaefolia]
MYSSCSRDWSLTTYFAICSTSCGPTNSETLTLKLRLCRLPTPDAALRDSQLRDKVQLFSLASMALPVLTTIQAKDILTLRLHVYTSGVDDWAACTGNLECSNPSSVCVKYSNYSAQCKPETLPSGELCGQDDDTNVCKYDHCPMGETCTAEGGLPVQGVTRSRPADHYVALVLFFWLFTAVRSACGLHGGVHPCIYLRLS